MVMTRMGPTPLLPHLWWLLTRVRVVRVEMPGRPLNGQPMTGWHSRADVRRWLSGARRGARGTDG